MNSILFIFYTFGGLKILCLMLLSKRHLKKLRLEFNEHKGIKFDRLQVFQVFS